MGLNLANTFRAHKHDKTRLYLNIYFKLASQLYNELLFAYAKFTEVEISCAETTQLIQAFVFAIYTGELRYVKLAYLENKIFNICKISFNKRYLLHTYICLTPIATARKRNELTRAPPCTELTLNSSSVCAGTCLKIVT